jgi:hypothetical protein
MDEEPYRPRSGRHRAPPPSFEPALKIEVVEETESPFPWRRWILIGAVVALVGAGGYFLERQAAAYREVDVVQDAARHLSSRYAEVDKAYASSMEAHLARSPFPSFGPAVAINPGVRSATREWVRDGIAIIGDFLAKRERVPEELIKRIEASRAGPMAKESMMKNVREAALKAQRPVNLMNAQRAWLEKLGEVMAYLDSYAQGIALEEGELHFDDVAAGERYNDLLRGLADVERELQRQKQQSVRMGEQ